MSLAELTDLDARFVIGTYARQPVEFVRGLGSRLWDDAGNEYLDFLAGISVVQIGHGHPDLVAAIRDQAERLIHASNLYYTAPGIRLAERLSELSIGGKVFFTNSGAEANECALKLARRGRPGGDFVVIEGGFHGRTFGALSATPQESKQAPFAPLVPGFKVVPRDDPRALEAAVDDRTAAVLLEPVQGESGVHALDPAMLETARFACDRRGALLVFDEVQCGMGRTGSLWAWEATGVRPDVMTLAKGLAGGLPIGACIAAQPYADLLRPGDHGSTFAGGPLVCSAAHAVLDVITAEGFLDAVRAKGERLLHGLQELSGGRARGTGLMLAFESPDAPALVSEALLDERLVVNATGPDSVRLLPPLTVTDAEIDEALARLRRLTARRVGSRA